MRHRLLVGLVSLVLFGALFVVSAPAVSAKSACLCRCTVDAPDPGPQFTALTLGRSTCTADCSAACDGAGNIARNDDGTSAARLVQIACIPGSNDCAAGGFDVYEGVACVLQFDPDVSKRPADLAAFPEVNGQKPTCVVPVTAKNANIECQQYGGIARGGTCGFFESGQNVDSYFKSRPFLGGSPQTKNYTGTYATFEAWENQADFNEPSSGALPATAGICTRFGVECGGGPTYEGFDCADNISPIPHFDYVCIKPKTNTCGTVPPPSGQDPVLPARSYSCQSVTGWSSEQLRDRCFPTGGSYADLCVQAGTRCCQGGTAFSGCLSDSDCSTDGTRVCEGESFASPSGLGETTLIPVTQGQCIWKTVCDADNEDRRCRSTDSAAERENPGFCSPESVVPTAPRRCPRTGESCCIPRTSSSVNNCAADHLFEDGPNSVWKDFGCIKSTDVTPQQFGANNQVIGIGDQATVFSAENDYNGSGQYHCLTSDLVRQNGSGGVARCSPGSVCCNKAAVQGQWESIGRTADFAAREDARQPDGGFCGATGMSCRDWDRVLPASDEDAQARGFPSVEAYRQALTTHPGCQITPLEGSPVQNMECQDTLVCCHPQLDFASAPCVSDEQCGGDVCDTVLHQCVNAAFAGRGAFAFGDGCLERSDSSGEVIDELLSRSNTESNQWSCQNVNETDPRVATLCAPGGCETAGQRCCAPGVGQSAGAASQQGAAATPQAPFSLRISSCIKDGNCGIKDILYTGAQFANFLLAISGAVFLAIFVYGGFMYLTSGYTSRYSTAKDMIIKSTWAMVLILGASIFIQFIQGSLLGGS